MGKIPAEKEYTRAELQKAINLQRRIIRFVSKASRPSKLVYGREKFLETKEGRIRVLAYGFENEATLPLFVNVHGGGFTAGTPETDDKYMKELASAAGVKVLNVEYSLSPEVQFPKAVDECRAVVEYARERAGELGIDPEKIAIGGHSAGGNLSASICLKDIGERRLGIRCVILDYPPLDIYTDPYLKPSPKGCIPPQAARIADPSYCHRKEDRKNPLVSPTLATVESLRGFPPALVITASGDSLCEEAERFKDKLLQAGVEVVHRRFEAKHGFTHYGGPDADEAWSMMAEFLKKCLDC